VHPTERSGELPNDVSTIDSNRHVNYQRNKHHQSRLAARAWHTDITFEPVPSDFAMLKVHTLPETGGDTLWASAYEAYDRLSPAYQKFLEGLTATHDGNAFHLVAEAEGVKAFTGERGHPLNNGSNYTAVHPVIRTNPVTGWKGLFVNGVFTKRINELTKDESDETLKYLANIVTQNHDLQVRHPVWICT
jgi:alpha-ketoglutarate-dependent taurine dioxygenase